ncbi:unnamed protein product, partial [Ectocarpus fasciculatus]
DGVAPTLSVGGAANARTEVAGARRATAAEEVADDVNEQSPYVVAVTEEAVMDGGNDSKDSCNGATVVDDIDNGSDDGGVCAGEACDGLYDSGCRERGASTHPFDP